MFVEKEGLQKYLRPLVAGTVYRAGNLVHFNSGEMAGVLTDGRQETTTLGSLCLT